MVSLIRYEINDNDFFRWWFFRRKGSIFFFFVVFYTLDIVGFIFDWVVIKGIILGSKFFCFIILVIRNFFEKVYRV